MKISIVAVDNDGSDKIIDEIETRHVVELTSNVPLILDVDEGHETVYVQFQAREGKVEVIREPDNNLVIVRQAAAVPA